MKIKFYNILSFLFNRFCMISLLIYSLDGLGQKINQPLLSKRSIQMLNVNGLQFKDLNKNGNLDPYEDWRLSVDTRVINLLTQMTLEEKIGFMLISTTRMAGDGGFQENAGKIEISSGFNEEDLIQANNIFTRKPLAAPMLSAAGTTKAVLSLHLRHFILRANTSTKNITK